MTTIFGFTVASIKKREEIREFEGKRIKIQWGEFSSILSNLVKQLELVLPFCANENQRKMHELYIESYRTGPMEAHKDSQRQWIADKEPNVESNQGWIDDLYRPGEHSRLLRGVCGDSGQGAKQDVQATGG